MIAFLTNKYTIKLALMYYFSINYYNIILIPTPILVFRPFCSNLRDSFTEPCLMTIRNDHNKMICEDEVSV